MCLRCFSRNAMAHSASNAHEAWNIHLAASGAQDLDKIMPDYEESSLVQAHNTVPMETSQFKGLVEIRTMFAALFGDLKDLITLSAPGINVDAHEKEIFLECPGCGCDTASDTFIFSRGKSFASTSSGHTMIQAMPVNSEKGAPFYRDLRPCRQWKEHYHWSLDLRLGGLPESELEKLKQEAECLGKGSFAFAFYMDRQKEERERGVSIACTTKEFYTENWHYTIIDSPGHREFVKTMIAGASQADFAMIMVPADGNLTTAITKGNHKAGEVQDQTRRHSRLFNLLGIKEICIGVNKMDCEQDGLRYCSLQAGPPRCDRQRDEEQAGEGRMEERLEARRGTNPMRSSPTRWPSAASLRSCLWCATPSRIARACLVWPSWTTMVL